MPYSHREARLLRLFSDLPLSVRVSPRARRVRIRVLMRGEVELVLPRGVDPLDAAEFLDARRDWIRASMDRVRRRTKAIDSACDEVPRSLALWAIGERWEVVLDAGLRQAAAPMLAVGTCLRIPFADGESASVQRRLRFWLLGRAREILPSWLSQVSLRTGIPYLGVRVKDLRSRWGSCSVRGQINLNSRLMFLPPELVDYVMVHELCHIRHMNHGPAFWCLLEDSLPGGRDRGRELRRGGAWVPQWMECDKRSTQKTWKGAA